MTSEKEMTITTLESTPTWAVATVVLVLILISLFIEHLLHLLVKYFNRNRRKSLIKALDKIKSDLMMLGFVSLLLTVSQERIAKICIPKGVAQTFLPCSHHSDKTLQQESKCEAQGKASLLSRKGVAELQYMIFVLAFFHSLSCVLTFSLGMAKMRRWGAWEAETRTLEYEFSNDPRRFQLIHQTSFARRHLRCWSEHRILRWPACFVQQFFSSKVDYITLRHGFIMAHFGEGSNFDFQKYIKRALEKDFRVMVGISLWIWILSMFFIFFNAHDVIAGWNKVAMSLDSNDQSQVVRGTFLVKPSDNFFWFGWPKLLLHLMHFILFQNSFQLAFFTWTWYKFGLKSCFHRKSEDIVIRLAMGVLVQILCGYVTLPLYALVTQMGTLMKNSVFSESVMEGLKKWRANAKKNIALKNNTTSPQPSCHVLIDPSLNTNPSLSAWTSPVL